MNKPAIHIKRIYENPDKKDGCRVLVDRLWPRGISRERALLDGWMKDVAPSTELRKWFDHKAARFAEFTRQYETELQENSAAVNRLLEMAEGKPLTLLYAAKDTVYNHAIVLKTFLENS